MRIAFATPTAAAEAAEYRPGGGGAVYSLTAPDSARDLLGMQEMGDLVRRLEETREDSSRLARRLPGSTLAGSTLESPALR
jgi:hypothetical protein